MKSFIKKIAKPIAIGVFFMALFFNVKVSLEDPFLQISDEVHANTSSSSSGDVAWICCQSNSSGCITVDGEWYPRDYYYFNRTACP
jgi:hypothetical protein